MTNQELQSAIMSTVANGVNEEKNIVRAVQACVYVNEARVRHHLHALRATRIWPSEQVHQVLHYTPRMDWRVGEGIYEVI